LVISCCIGVEGGGLCGGCALHGLHGLHVICGTFFCGSRREIRVIFPSSHVFSCAVEDYGSIDCGGDEEEPGCHGLEGWKEASGKKVHLHAQQGHCKPAPDNALDRGAAWDRKFSPETIIYFTEAAP
jgi:hypothetical protein